MESKDMIMHSIVTSNWCSSNGEYAFQFLFGVEFQSFENIFNNNIDHLKEQLDKEELHEYDSKTCLAVLKKQFEPFFDLNLKETIISYLNSIEKMIDERACHEEELRITKKDVKDKQEKLEMEKQETMIQKSKCSSPGDNSVAKREKQEMKENRSKTFQELKNVVLVLNPRLRKQCKAFLMNGNPKSLDLSMFSYYLEVFQKYTLHDIKSTKDMLVRYLNAIEKGIDARAHHEEELARVYDSRVNEKTMQTQAGMVYMAEGVDIRLSNDTKPLHDVQSTVVYNMNANDRQHVEQLKFINDGKVDQDAEQCLENKTTESLNQNS
ncbi:hypothetical protein Tco_0574328 [Tanacetum coccineum]